MKNYTVTFSYSVQVEAVDKNHAEIKGKELWDELCPKTDEMNIKVTQERK